MDRPLTDAERFPLLTPAGRERLRFLEEHPSAPRYNHRCGDLVLHPLGRRAKQSPRLTRRALAAELDAAGLELGRVIPVMPLLSEVWVVVVRKPGSS